MDKYYLKKRDVLKAYRRTPLGYLENMYRGMSSRVRGIDKRKEHLYKGLEIVSKEEFLSWALSDKNFIELHRNWVKSDYKAKLRPSCDRIDPNVGYVFGNMQFLTLSENSRKTRSNRCYFDTDKDYKNNCIISNGKLTKEQVIQIRELCNTMKYKDVAKLFNVSSNTISRVYNKITYKHV